MSKESITIDNGQKTKLTDDFHFIVKFTNMSENIQYKMILQGRIMDYGSAFTVIREISNNLRKLRQNDSWNELKTDICNGC